MATMLRGVTGIGSNRSPIRSSGFSFVVFFFGIFFRLSYFLGTPRGKISYAWLAIRQTF